MQDLNQMTIEELRSLNHSVVAEIKKRQQVKNYEALKTVNVGDWVRFDSGRRGIVTMLVEEIRGKNLVGKTKYGAGWRVAAGLVTIMQKGA